MIDQQETIQKEINSGKKEMAVEKTREDHSGGSSGDQRGPDTISRLLLERDTQASPLQEIKEAAPEPRSAVKDKISKASSPSEDPDRRLDGEVFKREAEKARQELESTKKWGHANSQKLKRAMVQTKEFIESGDLSEEEGRRLLDILTVSASSSPSFAEERESSDDRDPNPFTKIFKIANTELENVRKYTEDDLLEQKVKAFDYFLSVATPAEHEELLAEFSELIDQPISLTKKMLSIGQKCYEESYRDIQEAGGFKGYIAKKNTEIEKLSKTIDKLNKKLSQYEDYDRPTYGLKEMGTSDEKNLTPVDTITGLFTERDRPILRR